MNENENDVKPAQYGAIDDSFNLTNRPQLEQSDPLERLKRRVIQYREAWNEFSVSFPE